MDPLLREIFVAFGSCAILWVIWFFIAKSKNNHKQMIWATLFCCFAFFTMAFSPLVGAAFWGAYALINYVKKMGDTPTQAPQDPQQMEIPIPKEKKEEEKQPDTKSTHVVECIILLVAFGIVILAVILPLALS